MFLSVAQTPKNQSDSLFALDQLKKLYFHHSKEDHFPNIQHTAEGKPFFLAPQAGTPHPWQFNLSHSKGWVAVALDVHPIGVDLQVYRPVSKALIDRVCSPSEVQWLSTLPLNKQEQGFAFLWSGKEAVCKESGTGIGSGRTLGALSLVPSEPSRNHIPPTKDVSLLGLCATQGSTLARRLTPHFALAVSGLGVTTI